MTNWGRVGVREDDFQRWVDAQVDAALRPRPARPWWWWLVCGAYVSWVLACAWVIYRTAAGHPVLGGLQW